MENQKIRQAIARNRLKYYEAAGACGVSHCTFSVWLRKKLSPDRERQVMEAITILARQQTVREEGA